MKTKIIILICTMCTAALAEGQGIKFVDNLTWDQIKSKAAAENKNIFVDFYTTWCMPCKAMDENVYPIKEVGDYFNENYISIKVQMDSTGKDNEPVRMWRQTAKMMEKQYVITAYPTTYFLSSSGQPLMKAVGLQSVEGLLQMAAIALDTNSNYAGLYRQYLAGKRSSEFVLKLIQYGNALGQQGQVDEIGRQYINSIPETELFNKNNLLIINAINKKINDRGFQIFFNQPQKVVDSSGGAFTVPYLNLVVGSVITQELISPYLTALNGQPDWSTINKRIKLYGRVGNNMLLRAKYTEAASRLMSKFKADGKPVLQRILSANKNWNSVLSKIKSLNLDKGEEYVIGSILIYYMNHINENFDNFFQAAGYYEQKFNVMLSSQSLNDWAWLVFQNTSDKQKLNKALIWSKAAIDLAPGQPNNIDTYANLLHKLGHTDEAIKWEERALAASPGNADFIVSLERMKNNEPTWAAQ